MAVVAAATLWGLNGTMTRFLFTSPLRVPPLVLVQVRISLSFVLLGLALALFCPRLLRIKLAQLPYLAVFGVLGLASVQFLYSYTISLTNVATAIFLQYLAPVLTALWVWQVRRNRPTAALLLSLGLSMGGTSLLLFGGGSALRVAPLGLVTGLLSAVALAFYSLWGSRGMGKINVWTASLYGYGFGALATTVIGGPLTPFRADLSVEAWLFLAYVALLGTIVPFGLYFVGLSLLAPEQVTIVATLEPVVGAVSAYLFLGETLAPGQLAGAALVLAAALVVQRSGFPREAARLVGGVRPEEQGTRKEGRD